MGEGIQAQNRSRTGKTAPPCSGAQPPGPMAGWSPRSMQQGGAGWSPNGTHQEEAGDQRQLEAFSHQAVRSRAACGPRKGQEEARQWQVPPSSASSLVHQVNRIRTLPSLLPSLFQRGTQTPSPPPAHIHTQYSQHPTGYTPRSLPRRAWKQGQRATVLPS